MAVNGTMMQYFEWHTQADGKHWKRLKEDAAHLHELGITAVWIPPCFKSTYPEDVGYGIYDLFDLGEFDQKGGIATKYGTKEELLEAIEELHKYNIQVYADVVLNHKGGADGTEQFMAVEVDPMDRHKEISEPHEIEGWTRFYFPGRQKKYSDFEWHWYHFSGTDKDEATGEEGIFRIEGENKGWADDSLVDTELGNYDYLMYANIDYNHPDVAEHIKEWAKWFVNETGVDGFRLDAVKHIHHGFISELVDFLHEEFGEDFYIVAEYWQAELENLENYLKKQQFKISLMDVQLHFSFHDASLSGNNYDLRSLFDETLILERDEHAVTFVDNHDSQLGQSLESWVDDWFKPLAYGWILLTQKGYPCIFYGDYYGIMGSDTSLGIRETLDKLMYARKEYAYGKQENYVDHPNCIGFVRKGNEEYPEGCAVVLSNSEEGWKKMNIGHNKAGQEYTDLLGNRKDTIIIGEDGWAFFPVDAGSISVWIKKSE